MGKNPAKKLAKEQRQRARKIARIHIFGSKSRKDKAEGFELSKKKIILAHVQNERVQFLVYVTFVFLATLSKSNSNKDSS